MLFSFSLLLCFNWNLIKKDYFITTLQMSCLKLLGIILTMFLSNLISTSLFYVKCRWIPLCFLDYFVVQL